MTTKEFLELVHNKPGRIGPVAFNHYMSLIKMECADAEQAHGLADDLLCETLRRLGYAEGIAIYDKLDKWYS